MQVRPLVSSDEDSLGPTFARAASEHPLLQVGYNNNNDNVYLHSAFRQEIVDISIVIIKRM